MIVLLLALAVQLPTEPGEFRHGGWQGRCYRDGILRGMPKELCRARLEGQAVVAIERDKDQLEISVSVPDCTVDQAVGFVDAGSLASPGRVGLLRVMIETQQKGALKACGSRAKPDKLVQADIEALLHETDGLAALQP